MKLWQSLLLCAVLLVVIGLLLCDDIGAHTSLKECETAVALKPDTVYHVDTLPPEVGTHLPVVVSHIPQPKPLRDTVHDTTPAEYSIASRYTFSMLTKRGDSIIAYLQSKAFPKEEPADLLGSIRFVPALDTQITINHPVIIIRKPWYSHWYVEVPAAILAGYGLYQAGKHWK